MKEQRLNVRDLILIEKTLSDRVAAEDLKYCIEQEVMNGQPVEVTLKRVDLFRVPVVVLTQVGHTIDKLEQDRKEEEAAQLLEALDRFVIFTYA